jgi:hypothetical protein
MNNPVKDIDNLIYSLTSLKRAINKFNRNSPTVKVEFSFGVNGCHYIELKNTTKNNYNKLTHEDDYIIETEYTTEHCFNKKTISIVYEYINDTTINDLILLLNKIFECLNLDVPKKSEFEEHCELASELVSEWPQWKQDVMRREPYTYEPPDPQ